MSGKGQPTAAQIRARLNHPIIDADGHWLEFGVLGPEEMRRIGGAPAAEGFAGARQRIRDALSMSVADRRRRGIAQEAFWAFPTKNTLDRATAMFPRLLYERLPELGIDFAALYPTAGLSLPRLADATVRRATCLQQLGPKVAMFGSLIRRPVPAATEAYPGVAGSVEWCDTLGVDSKHDYDPVWKRCGELGVSPTFHTGGRSFGLRNSPTNFVYNHIGHFSSGQEAVCKSLFLAGVTRRFPALKFAFLEGGVGWACTLYADLIGHWERRNRKALENTDPRNLDWPLMRALADKYAIAEVTKALREREALLDAEGSTATGGIADLDDFSPCRIDCREDIRDLFVPSFYFGCEADDPFNAWAFHQRTNPLGARLNAVFGSDIGHFDVPDTAEVVPEAYELVEDELITTRDFRDFTFANAVRLWGTANPEFFKGTGVEAAVASVLAEPSSAPR